MTVADGRTSVCGWAVLVFCGVLALACAARAELVVYPEYPAALERDFAYAVSVTQKGGETKPLVVYNHTEQSALSERTRGGDVNRRFCEFAFSGEPVRVDIRVRRDVSSYKVFPARFALRHRFKDGVISVRVDHPMQFGIQLNDRDHTILSVFADPPETDVPAKDAPGVMYVEGWRDAPGRDGVVEIGPDVRELYLAPGSVFNARLRVCGAGTKVHGRGVVLDPMSDIFRYDQTANAERGLFVVRAPKVSVEGIKFLDARTFNLMSFHPDVSFRNVKVLSSMMCSDGMTCGSTGLTVENCWFYVGDNAVVLSGVTGARFRDVALGTSCAAIFPQNSNRDVLFERTDVFRCDDGLINNRYNGVLRRNNKWSELGSGLQKREPGPQDLPHQTDDIAFRDLSAVDCTLFPHLFSGRNMGVKPKRYAFTNLSIPKAAGKSHWRAAGRTGGCLFRVDNDPKRWLQTGNYSFAITNLVLDGEEVQSLPKGCVKGSDGEIRVAVAATADSDVLPRRADRTEVEWKSSERNPAAVQGTVTNLLAETSRAKSVWQRFPSWSVKLEATKKDEKGSTVYRLVQCERNAGMQAVVTDAFLGRGNGRWCLRCEARVADGKPLTLTARLLSNETEYSGRAKLEPGGWQRLEIDFDTNFDLNVTELVALVLGTDRAVSELEFRDFIFVRDEASRAPPQDDTPRYFDMRRTQPTEMRTVKPSRKVRAVLWGIVHNHARGKLEAMRKLKDDYEVVGWVDDSKSRSVRMWDPNRAICAGLPCLTPEDVFERVKPDLVVIEVSNSELVEVAKECARRGYPMHMDKPLGVTLDGFREISDICRKGNIPLQTGYMFRANEAIQFVCKSAKDGLVGDVFHISADLSHSYGGKVYPDYASAYPGGIAYLLSCHVVDYVLPIMGDRLPDRVVPFVKPAPGDPADAPTHSFSVLEWPRTICAIDVCSKGTQPRRHLRIDGTDGVLEIEPIEDIALVKHRTGLGEIASAGERIRVRLYLKAEKPPYRKGMNVLDFGVFDDRYAGQLRELAEIIRGERPNPVELYDHDLKVHQVSLQVAGIPLR